MNVDRLRQISQENMNLMISKNQDYSGQSGDNISITGIPGIASRLIDKTTRLHNLSNNKKGEINFESIKDTLNDISNYGLIGRLVEEGSWALLPKLVYLAGPIDGISVPDAVMWRNEVTEKLTKHGISTFSPPHAFNVGDFAVAKQVYEICKITIYNSDLILAYLDGPGMAFGTIREIEYARSLDKRVIVVSSKLNSLFSYDVEVVSSIETAIGVITKSNIIRNDLDDLQD